MRSRLLPVLALSLVVTALAAGCASDSGSPPPNGGVATKLPGGVSKPSGEGSLIMSKTTGLAEYDLKSGKVKFLVAASEANSFLLDPAVSADGKQIAYIVQPPPKIVGTTYDSGADLWMADRDGGNPRVVLAHPVANQLIRFPQWQDAGHILAVVQEISTEAGRTNVDYYLERIDVATGERAQVLKNVISFGLSPDGSRIVYTKLAPQTGETLNLANIDGTGDTVLVGLDQNLSPFNTPRFSPDGTTIAFASADQTGARAAFEYVVARPGAGAGVVRPADALLDGLPEDIWTISVSGGQAKRIADLKEDLPALTWGGDGNHVYVIGAAGLYDVNVATGAQSRIGEGSFHALIAWAP
jgi:Tol biopolymer transport system component